MRLDKFLAHSGFGTRSEVRRLIKKGVVKVNGRKANSPDLKVDEEKDVVQVGEKIVKLQKWVYIMMNKPQGYVCSNDDPFSPTIFSLIPENLKYRNLHTVGRLDKDAEGLLIITNNGEYTHKVISPKKHIEKEYIVKLEKELNREKIKVFEDGVVLDDGYKTMPAKYTIIDDFTVSITIHEGKYHQIKRMFESIGNRVVYLKRIRIGRLKLDENLNPGEYKVLDELDAFLVFE
ncbi:pseudouridine synthase [Caldicellulosiruptor naganoensis]|uniref:Pseudouridine synthase n=1 Tax=Caldicellulosiruptor naganoensis TaxID=29324 RepID=A0ABY7BEF5_9FIRM|nr:pseudouridine synthase [Caldicellulosiruptor naganoensis]WAM30742.1 rRNA pseudouridine synthase [Caldicellulosiruptor naganoensis]